MRQISDEIDINALNKISYVIGSPKHLMEMAELLVKIPYDEEVVAFLASLSRLIMKNPMSKTFPDVITFGFWIRKASIQRLKERFEFRGGVIRMGCGVVFHIAPSNVPVNFAYSLVAGMLMGNSNIVRIPSNEYPQVDIIVDCIKEALKDYEALRQYICLVRYGHEREINDVISSISDVRVVWGGDSTIRELRKSHLSPRCTEINFADRFSLAVIDSDAYIKSEDKQRIASDFYNDTYMMDQNACTSPRLVVWTGTCIEEAKTLFWNKLHEVVKLKYNFQSIMGVNKLCSAYLVAANKTKVRIIKTRDNLLVRVQLLEVSKDIIEYRENSGYFFEYDCDDLMELRELCNDKRIQTVVVIGNPNMINPLILSGIKGIDRIVPVGKSMDFDLYWDGLNLTERLTRVITL